MDEIAVNYIVQKNYDVIKIASCSFNDWSLLEEVVKQDKFIIASTAGATKLEIDKVYSFLKHKNKSFALLLCWRISNTNSNLHLNQINYLISNYQNVRIGWSTHEEPNNYDSVKIAISKGATIFEKHVGVEDARKGYKLNPYSANPEQIENWLESARQTLEICGPFTNERKTFSEKENQDLRILHRGAFAKKDLAPGDELKENYFLAMPNIKDQLVAKDLGKFSIYKSKVSVKKGEPLMISDFQLNYDRGNIEDRKFIIKDKIIEMINKENIVLPKNVIAEISHHYGIDNFFKKGAILFHIINQEYCKIVIMMFPNQEYPAHYHNLKDETYFILSGDLTVNYENKKSKLKPGDTITIDKQKIHSFSTENGVVFEEIGTKYIKGDSNYIDQSIKSRDRKSYIDLYK